MTNNGEEGLHESGFIDPRASRFLDPRASSPRPDEESAQTRGAWPQPDESRTSKRVASPRPGEFTSKATASRSSPSQSSINDSRLALPKAKKHRRTTKLSKVIAVLDEEEDEEDALAKMEESMKNARLEEESSIRTAAEVTQLQLTFGNIFSSLEDEVRVTPCERPRPLLQYFQLCVRRVVEMNRTWCLQLKVQRLVSGTLMDGAQPKKKQVRTRQQILRSVQEGQNYWENIAAADRHTSMMVVPTAHACVQYKSCDRDDIDANRGVVAPPKEPPPPPPQATREYSTLRQYSTRFWPSDVRRAGGMRSCPGTKDGVQRGAEFQNYLDLLLFEQDKQSAIRSGTGVLGCSEGFLRSSRPSRLPQALDVVAEDAALTPPDPDQLGTSTGSFRGLSDQKSGGRRSSLQVRHCGRHSRGTPQQLVEVGQLEMHLPPLQETTSSAREGSAREPQPAAGSRLPEHLPPIKNSSAGRSSAGCSMLSSKRSAMHKDVLQDLRGARPAAAAARSPRGLPDASLSAHAPLFNPLPPSVRLEGCPLRRRGQARIVSEFTTDRILAEFEGDMAMPEDNESRPEVLYFRRCNEMSIMPAKLEFLSEDHEEEIRLSKLGLTDEQVEALGNAFSKKAPSLQVLDLSENRLLTDASLQPTILRLTHLSNGLRVLRLGGTQLGAGTIKVLAQAMVTKFQLEDLSLQSVPMPDMMWQVLCQAIVKAGTVTRLDVSDTQCGRWRQSSCIQLSQMFMELPSLKAADLSNNYFRSIGLEALGKAVAHPRFRLEALTLDDNAWTDTEAIVDVVGGVLHPMVSFCEQIRYNKSLQWLGLRRSQVDVMAAYCLEDSILNHKQLQELQVEGNPFGEYGLRSLLRCLLRSASPLEVLGITEFRDISVKPSILFNYGDLTEDYTESQTLDLGLPYHRAVLRLILSRTEDFQQPPLACLQKLKIDGRPPDQCPFHKDTAGLWSVPTSGKVEFSLVLTVPPGTSCAEDFLLNWQTARRLPVGVSKFMFLHRTWLSLQSDRERRLFIEAVAKECMLKLAHLRIFADEVKRTMPNLLSVVVSGLSLAMPFIHRACIVSALIPSVQLYKSLHMGASLNSHASAAAKEQKDGIQENDEQTWLAADWRPRKEGLVHMRKLMLLNPGNPNGRYDLDLSDPLEYTVAERVLLVAVWEASIAKAQGCRDLSQTGGFNAIRNFTVNGEAVLHMLDWQLPGDGYSAAEQIGFDYVSLRRPKATDPVLSESGFEKLSFFLKDVTQCLTESALFFSILKASHTEVLSPDQLAGIISFTSNAERRRDLFCSLFTRCGEIGPPLVDVYTGVLGYKPGRVPGLFTADDRLIIRERIGNVNELDWVHIDEAPLNCLRLDLSHQDAQNIAPCILELADLESKANMVDTWWTGIRNKSLTSWSPPAEWRDDLPDHGIFEVTYVLEKPEVLSEQARRQLAARVSWPEDPNLADVHDESLALDGVATGKDSRVGLVNGSSGPDVLE